jgi:serpin B
MRSCILVRIIAIFFLCSAAGCGDSGKSAQPGGATVAQSSLARNLTPQVPDADLAAVVSGNSDFALKVFPLLDAAPGSNAFFSPYSITQAFLLLAPGARGTTLSGIEQALAFPFAQDRLNPAFDKLDLLITGRTTGTVLANGLQGPKLDNANAVWGQQGFSILPSYLDTLALNFGGALHLVDFKNAAENSRQTINAWVEQQTGDKIVNLIPERGVSTDTRVVLTNAIWFKANWASQFSPIATTNKPFHNRDGSAPLVPFMTQSFSAGYAQADGCQAIDIPYAGDDLSMLVIMPNAGTMDTFLPALTATLVTDITNHLSTGTVNVSMPKFSFSKTYSMATILESLGMTDAMDPARADLSGIDGNRDLSVAAVFHQAFVSVDEVGTEAAAATAIVIGPTAVLAPDAALTIDHPFIFLIRDRQTGLILFMGKVVFLQS